MSPANSRPTIRILNAYEIFSFFLPGLVANLAMLLLLPDDTLGGPLGKPSLISLGLLNSIVVGISVHAIAERLETTFGRSNRETFRKVLGGGHPDKRLLQFAIRFIEWLPVNLRQNHPTERNDVEIQQFWTYCETTLGDRGITDGGAERTREGTQPAPTVIPSVREAIETDDDWEMLYRHVRERVALDGRGRTGKFESIYGFCRSMSLTLLVVAAAYMVALQPGGAVSCPSAAESTQCSIILGILNSTDIGSRFVVGLLVVGALLFFVETRKFQLHYIDYMISDFVNIVRLESDSR